MDVEDSFEGTPFADLFGIERRDTGDGRAEGRLETLRGLLWCRERVVAHDSVAYTLSDTVCDT